MTRTAWRPAAGGRAFRWLVAVSAATVAAACARGRTGTVPYQPLVFPPPPEVARVQYVGSIFSPRDLPSERSRWADFVLGEPPVEVRFVKPYACDLTGTRLYVCDTILNTVLVFDLAHGGARPLLGDSGIGKIKQPNGILIGPDGTIYIADKERHAVLVYGPDEQYRTAWGRPGEADPVAVAIHGDRLYVCDIKDHEIEVWDAHTGEFIEAFGGLGTAPGKFFMPIQIRVDAAGDLYVTDSLNFRVQKLSPDGKPIRQFGSMGTGLGQFAQPKGMDLDPHGRLYVADARFCNVQIFDPQGRLLLFFGAPGPEGGYLDLPAGLRIVPWPKGIAWLEQRLMPGFDPESLIMVVSQHGAVAVNLFAVARDPQERWP